jgi:hypothetical protein
MSNLTIKANICEINDGPFFQVKLYEIPRKGELIELFSYLDANKKHNPKKKYEVVEIVHDIHEVSDSVPMSVEGAHFVSIFVKPVDSSDFFD